MELPGQLPVMILPNTTLFPQMMLPLYIFEPRYRRMLADVLATHRLFVVAMQRPGARRETPAEVGGLGLVRAVVTSKDGTSNLILQGLTRVDLVGAVRYKPYRIEHVIALEESRTTGAKTDALVARVRELVTHRVRHGFQLELPQPAEPDTGKTQQMQELAEKSFRKFVEHVATMDAPAELADLVSSSLLSDPLARQVILETIGVEARLEQLVRFLRADIRKRDQDSPS